MKHHIGIPIFALCCCCSVDAENSFAYKNGLPDGSQGPEADSATPPSLFDGSQGPEADAATPPSLFDGSQGPEADSATPPSLPDGSQIPEADSATLPSLPDGSQIPEADSATHSQRDAATGETLVSRDSISSSHDAGHDAGHEEVKYAGYFGAGFYPSQQASIYMLEEVGNGNTTFISEYYPDDHLQKLALAKSLNKKVVLYVQHIFFDSGLNLNSDCQTKFDAYIDAIEGEDPSYLDLIVAVYPIDEPYWQGELKGVSYGAMYANLVTINDVIKNRLPSIRIPVIFAYASFFSMPNFQIPETYDWVGFDCYGSWHSCGSSSYGYKSIPAYLSELRSKMSTSQRLILVPQSFLGITNRGQDDLETEQEVTSVMEKYFDYAQQENSVVGIFMFHLTAGYSGAADRDLFANQTDHYVPGDYDGDSRTDISIKTFDGYWKIDYAANGFGAWDVLVKGYGDTSHESVPGDYDGDGVTDIAVRTTGGSWSIDYAHDGFGSWNTVFHGYGDASQRATPADYDGDGKVDFSIKSSSGLWFIDYSSNGRGSWDVVVGGYGDFTCDDVPADYDGDGKDDISFRTSSGDWSIDYAWDHFAGVNVTYPGYGSTAAIATPADYDGDGSVDLSLKTASGYWFIDYSSVLGFGAWDTYAPGYGAQDSLPLPGDYDGDGHADCAFLDTTEAWKIDHYSGGFGAFDASHWGHGKAVWHGARGLPTVKAKAESVFAGFL